MTLPLLSMLVALTLGLLVGSFSNVLIWRLPRRENINFPPSHCPVCAHRIGARDLIPVLSWLALRGRCRSCSTPISARYPLVELFSGAGYLLLAWRFPPYGALSSLHLVSLCLLLTLLVASVMIAADHDRLPLRLPATGAGLLLLLLAATESLLSGGLAGRPSLLPFQVAAVGAVATGAALLVLTAVWTAVQGGWRGVRLNPRGAAVQGLLSAALIGALVGAVLGTEDGMITVGLTAVVQLCRSVTARQSASGATAFWPSALPVLATLTLTVLLLVSAGWNR